MRVILAKGDQFINFTSTLAPADTNAVANYLSEMQQRFPDLIQQAVLYGSKARGDDDFESDIDLLVLTSQLNRELRDALWQIASRVSLTHDVVLSVAPFAQEDWTAQRQLGMPFVHHVEAERIALSLPALATEL